jgi:hypothetical protein
MGITVYANVPISEALVEKNRRTGAHKKQESAPY